MSKMIIYFCLFIPLLFLTSDASSIRGRNHKNDLVPFLSSRLDTLKKDPNSLKVVSKEPFIIQLQMPNAKEMEARAAKEKDKKRKRPGKKRVLKIKPLRKQHRKRRDLLTLRAKPREEKKTRFEILHPANKSESQFKNITKNSLNRMEILNALSSHPKKTESKLNKLDGIRTLREEGKINTGRAKKNSTSNRNPQKHNHSLSERTKMTYPSTPKLDRQKYTYKDLMADRERLEQKIKYIKNMLNVNDSTTDDPVRVRRRSDSDRAANKIAKMFLTLSAVNGLNDRKKSKCKDEDDDEDRVEDVWEKERRNNPLRKSTSSNEERYKVKKWIEFMKNKRSSGKTCPCVERAYGEESDAFPLEQKLPKGYFLLERGRSSEESSELYGDPYYYSRDKAPKNDNIKKRLSKSQEQDNKMKALNKNGKRKLEMPFEDLELYRSRARQILQNAEEILDKIKEEEEKRLAAPNILMSQIKELTSRIHGDPRNDENDLIRKIQKNLGWAPLTKPQDNADGTFLDNVKSFILDPYEKAKALTDESTKKLSSYLLRNLGRLQESSEEQEMRNADDEGLKIYFGEVPHKEEPPSSASLAREEPGLSKGREDLQNWEDTLSAILKGSDDALNKESNWGGNQEEQFQQKMESLVKGKQKDSNNENEEGSQEPEKTDDKTLSETVQSMKEIVAENKPGSVSEEERVEMILNEKGTEKNDQAPTEPGPTNEKDEKGIENSEDPTRTLEKTTGDSDIVQNQKFRGTEGTFQEEIREDKISDSRDMQKEKEFEKEIEEIVEAFAETEKDKKGSEESEETVQKSKIDENKEKDVKEETLPSILEKQEAGSENKKSKLEEDVNEETVASVMEKQEGNKNEKSKADENKDEDISKETVASALDKQEEKGEKQISEAEESKEKHADEDTVALVLEKQEDNKSKSKAEEDVNEKTVASALEKQEEKKENKMIDVPASPEMPETILKQEGPKDYTPDDRIAENVSSSRSPIDESSSKETKTVTSSENDQNLKEIVRTNLKDDDFESSKEPLLEKQLEVEQDELELKAEEKKSSSENYKKDLDPETTDESSLVSEKLQGETEKEDSLGDDFDQEESGAKTAPEHADLVRETEQNSKEYLRKEPTESKTESDYQLLQTEDKSGSGEKTLEVVSENQGEETIKQNEYDDTVEAVLDTEGIRKTTEGKIKSSSREETTENTPLRATLEKQENLEEEVDNYKSSSKEIDDALLKETISEDRKNEGMSEETIDKSKENKSEEILRKEKNHETSLAAETSEEDTDDQPKTKSTENENEEAVLKESNPDGEDDDALLKAVMTDQDQESKTEEVDDTKEYISEKDESLNSSSEMNLKASLDKVDDLEKDDEITEEKNDSVNEKDEKNDDFNENKDILKSAKSTEDVGNQNNEEDKKSKETLGEDSDTLESPNKKEEVTAKKEAQNVENMEGKDDVRAEITGEKDDVVRAENPDEDIGTGDKETNQGVDYSKDEDEETLKETNPTNYDDEYEEKEASEEKSSHEVLKAIPENQKQESRQGGEDELDQGELQSEKLRDNENLQAALEKEPQEDLEETPDEETVKVSEFEESQEDLEGTLKSQDNNEEGHDDIILKEANIKESEEVQDDIKNGDDVGAVLNSLETQTGESQQNFDETKKSEDVNDEKIILKATNFDEDDQNNQSLDSKSVEVLKNVQESLEEEYENVQAENPESDEIEDDDETPLKSSSLKDEFDNKIEDETPLKSVQSKEETDQPKSNKNTEEDKREETVQKENVSYDLNNQIDQENEEEDVLKSMHFDDESLVGSSEDYETGGENLKTETPLKLSHPGGANSQENVHIKPSGDLTPKSLKASKLKVPESIGKIMKDLDGKEKSDITSIQSLNPDKIDHMLGKIGEAEQQNLLQSEEVDCRKECACAEDMNTRSRNIGRYEIVKDFLHWVKDLQLNRVLTDD